VPKWQTIENHPDKQKIIRDLIHQKPLRDIAQKYKVSKSTVNRYLHDKLVEKAATVESQQKKRDGDYILRILDTVLERMQMLYDACHEYLLDPEDPQKYYLGPHAHELYVIYYEGEQKKKIRLDLLLEDKGKSMEGYEVAHIADPRVLIIKTSESIARQLELLSEIYGLIVKQVTINNVEHWTDVKALILRETARYPQVQEKIVEGLKKILGGLHA